MSRQSPCVIVIGAGPGGLAAAMLLAAGGARVTVFERLPEVGGRTRTFTAEGFRFDVGPTFFLYPQVLRNIFASCGLVLEDFLTLKRLDPSYCLAFEGGPQVRISNDLERLEAEIARIDRDDARRIGRFVRHGRRKLAAFEPVLQQSFLSPLSFLQPKVLKALRLLAPHRSLDQELARYFRDPRTRLAFSFQSKYLGMSPFRCPSLFTILSFLEFEFGVWHVQGGCGAVSQAQACAAARLGVQLRCDEGVERIEFRGRRAIGVHTASGFTPADAVVINADFAHAARRLIPPHLRQSWSDERIDAARYSCSAFMLYLGIEGRYEALDHHTVFLARDYARNIAEIDAAQAPPGEPSIYVQNPARTDPSFGNALRSSLYVLVPVGHCGAIDWQSGKQRYRDLVLKRLEGLGLAGLRERILYERMVTPEDWRSELAIHRGAVFNLTHDLGQMLYWRPHNRMQDVRGVYLVGGGTHPGSGLPVIYEGARITADVLLRDLGIAPRAPGRRADPDCEPRVASGPCARTQTAS